jgi:4-hydroxybenzoyl-CoA reductase subunit beta
MLLPAHEFLKPASLADGLAALAADGPGTRLLGGGTDVVFNMRNRLFQPRVLLSVRELPELQGIRTEPDGGLRLGAGCRLADLAGDDGIAARYPALTAAARAVASSHVRNMATLGGNLNLDTRCWYTNQTQEWRAARGGCLKTGVPGCHVVHTATTCVAINNADMPPALIALGATAMLASVRGRRELPLAQYYRADGVAHTARADDELLLEVRLPPARGTAVFIKDTARQGIDFAYATVGAWRSGTELRLVLGSLGPAPVVLRQSVAVIAEQGWGDAALDAAAAAAREDLGTLTGLYTPASYKRELARTLVRRALEALRVAA